MNETWWEGIVSFLCDYWWILLIGLVLLITAFLTRDIWLPALLELF